MRRLFLILHNRFPGEKAASLFAAKSAEAFAHEGVSVTLLVPRRIGRRAGDPHSYYGVDQNFRIVYLPVLDFLFVPFFQTVFFWISFGTFSLACALYLFFASRRDDIIYSNETLPLWLASFFRRNTFYEMHDFPESKYRSFRSFLSRVRWVLAHNQWKKNRTVELFGVKPEKILCVPNAVDIGRFKTGISKEQAREQLGLPLERDLVVYTGHLYGWKGAETLAAASHLLPPQVLLVFVGGTPVDRARIEAVSDGAKTLFVGAKPHIEIPLWQAAADLLVLPNSAKEKISSHYTSPMKLFEYMASGRPIIASRLPSIEEIVGEREAYFADPDSPQSFAEAIVDLLADPARQAVLSLNADEKVRQFDWSMRAKKILDFISGAR